MRGHVARPVRYGGDRAPVAVPAQRPGGALPRDPPRAQVPVVDGDRDALLQPPTPPPPTPRRAAGPPPPGPRRARRPAATTARARRRRGRRPGRPGVSWPVPGSTRTIERTVRADLDHVHRDVVQPLVGDDEPDHVLGQVRDPAHGGRQVRRPRRQLDAGEPHPVGQRAGRPEQREQVPEQLAAAGTDVDQVDGARDGRAPRPPRRAAARRAPANSDEACTDVRK